RSRSPRRSRRPSADLSPSHAHAVFMPLGARNSCAPLARSVVFAMTPIRLAIVDDHRLFLLAVRTVLADADDIEVIGEADSGAKVLPLLESTQPELLLLDFSMPRPDGLQCLDQIRTRYPATKVAIVSGS